MNKIKAIRTDEDYEAALELLEQLMDQEPAADSAAADQLGILAVLIEKYESENFPSDIPDAVEAIKFRMDQLDLKPADLVPYLGSRSRVSEILSGQRTLSIDMIRALEKGLGIPAEALLKKAENDEDSVYKTWDKTLFKAMERYNYFGDADSSSEDQESVLKRFFGLAPQPMRVPALLRQANYRSAPTTDHNALIAWSNKLLIEAKDVQLSKKYKQGSLSLAVMQELARLSIHDDGVLRVKDALAKLGIILLVEPALPRTRLDGAAILHTNNTPVVGITLRLDRLDNFWFTLMHELAHVALHLKEEDELFYDELDSIKGLEVNNREKEADRLASEALVPAAKWAVSPARMLPHPMAAKSLAKETGVDIAIIAGKIRYESGKWAYLNDLIEGKTVRQFFPEKEWLK